MTRLFSVFILLLIQVTAHARVEAENLLKVPGIVRAERFEPGKSANYQDKYIYFSITYKIGRREFSGLIAYPRHFYQQIPAVVFTQDDELLTSLLPEINTDIFGGNGTRILIYSQTRGVEKEKVALLKIIRKLPLVDTRYVVFASSSRPALTQISCEDILRVEFDNWIWSKIMGVYD